MTPERERIVRIIAADLRRRAAEFRAGTRQLSAEAQILKDDIMARTQRGKAAIEAATQQLDQIAREAAADVRNARRDRR